MKCKSIIEIERELRKEKQEKNGLFVPVGVGAFCPGCQSRPGGPGWKTGTTGVSQPKQISVSVVVNVLKDTLGNERSITYIGSQMRETKWKAGFIQSPQGVLNPPN